MIKAASTENLSTTSARFAQTDIGNIDNPIARKYLETRAIQEKDGKDKETENKGQVPEHRTGADSTRKFSGVTEIESDPLYYRPGPSAPTDTSQQRPVVIGHPSFQVPCPKYDLFDVEKWLQIYEHVATANSWSDIEKFNRLFQAFDNTPYMDYYINLTNTHRIYDWPSAKRVFQYRQSDPKSLINAEAIYQRKQGAEESVAEYIIKKETLFGKIKPTLPEEFVVSQIAQGFKQEIYDKIMTTSLETPIKTVDELINKAISIEQLINSMANRFDIQKPKQTKKHVEFEEDRQSMRSTSQTKSGTDKVEPGLKNVIRSEMQDIKRSLND